METDSISEIKYEEKAIPIKLKKEFDSSYKISSYIHLVKKMEQKGIKQMPIQELIFDFFNKIEFITQKTKKSISKILYSPNDRIIVLITNHGQQIIWNRNKLTDKYGWFFFVTKKKEKEERSTRKSKGKKGSKKYGETTVKVSEFSFEKKTIVLKERKNIRPLYKTKEYNKYLNLINSNTIPQMDIMEVLNDFFYKYEEIPIKEKKAIAKINYYQEEKVIVIKSLIGDKMYEHLEDLVKKYGWYFYITGVSVGDSEISIAIDKIEKKFDDDHFQNYSLLKNNINLEDISLTLYPISHEPNHNCMILGIGDFKIMLDCGISEEHFEYINFYLENYKEILSKRKKEIQEGFNSRELVHKPPHQSKLSESEPQEINEDIVIEEDPSSDEVQIIEENKNREDKINKEEQKVESEYAILTSEGIDEEDLIQKKATEEKLDAIFISHSHFDHITGLKDLIKAHPDIPILSSRITMDLYLLRDSNFLKQEDRTFVEEEEYVNVINNIIYVENGTKIDFKENDCYLAFFHAGHMPGALMLLAKIKDFRFLYTGDYTYWDITPFAGTRRFLEQISRPIDFLLIDSTSAYEEFGDPYNHFDSLILFLEQKAEYGDCTLIGADPSSLAISFMLVFWRYFRKLQLREGFKKRPNIYVDMMVRKNIQVINHRYEYIYGPISRLIKDKANPFNSIKFRWFDLDDLDFLRKKNNIIISHPPDLSYGIIRNIMNVIGRNPHNLVFLAGSIHEEPGQSLVEGASELIFSETWQVPFRALLLNTFAPQIKIKLHGDQKQLFEMIKALEPKEICFFHQSPYKLLEVAEKVKEMGVEHVSVPRRRKLMILN